MRLSVVRLPVVLLGVVAVLGVAGILVWGGGEEPEYASAAGVDGGDFASSGAASDSPASASGTTVPPPPFNPASVAPIGGQQVTPTEPQALLAWRVELRDWPSALSTYRGNLGATGYRLGDQRISSNGGADGGAWDIEPDQPGYQSAIGLLYIGPAPDDPEATIVEVEVY